MRVVIKPARSEWAALFERQRFNNDSIDRSVREIIEKVRTGGDNALRELTRRIEDVAMESFLVEEGEFLEAEQAVSEELKDAIDMACRNVRKFHEAQMPHSVEIETMKGVMCVQRAVPIQKVGLYVPGGTAPLFSTVIMLAIPAHVAGCPEIVLCTPPDKNGRVAPEILYTARVCGVGRVFKIGGAQAVAAMAYGTESVPAVDKIFGPGNRYVTKAKQMVSTERVAIDMPAGPSEVLVLADNAADARFVAADLLSQAEHGADSQALLVTDSVRFADEVNAEIERQLTLLPRREAATKALDGSVIIVAENRDQMVDMANGYAAEHLIVSMDNPWEVADRIKAAGSIFVGNYSPESAGDYASGTNHTLPTSGWARSFSGVNVESYVRRITYQELSREGLLGLSGTIITMAEAEGLCAHANAVRVRLDAMNSKTESDE